MECWDVQDIWKNIESGFSPLTTYTIIYSLLFAWSALEILFCLTISHYRFANLAIAFGAMAISAILIGKTILFSAYIDKWQGLEDISVINYKIGKTVKRPLKRYHGPDVMSYRDYLREHWCSDNISISSMSAQQEEKLYDQYWKYRDAIMKEYIDALNDAN